MALLDWIKNRGQEVSAPANEQGGPRPETAQQKESYKPVASMSADAKSEAQAIGDRMKSISNKPNEPTPPPTPSAGGAANPQPMKQLSMAQDKTAPALSPSSAQMGMKEVDGPGAPHPTPAPSQAPPKLTRSMSPDF